MKVDCPHCGRTGRLPEGSILPSTVRCPQCKVKFSPVVNEEIEEAPTSKAWYKDPILQFAVAFPTVALICFGFYLIYQRSKSQFREQIVALKADGDKLQGANKLRPAFEKYQAVVAKGGGSSDPEVRKAVDEAKVHRDKLQSVLQAELEREEAERRRQEKEREIRAARLREEAELAKIQASLTGGAWVIKGGGQSDILRGLSIFVLRSELARRELDDAVAEMKRQPDFEDFGESAVRLASRPPDDRIDLQWYLNAVRYRKHSDDSNNKKMLQIRYDTVWPKFVKAALVAEAETNIDGKYKVPEIKGGKYLVYALHETRFGLIEWLLPLEIKRPGEVTLDLYNKNAETILNKDDD
jgi:hypothetical protein